MNRQQRRCNRRQRKKLRIGEFQELGFAVRALPAGELSSVAREAVIDAFIDQAVEENSLLCVGGFNDVFSCFLMAVTPYTSATEMQREAVHTWLSARPELTHVHVGPLCDDWCELE